ERHLTTHTWMLGADFSLADCDYGPTFNVLDKAGFSFSTFPHVQAYLEAIRSRRAWQDTPRLPGLWRKKDGCKWSLQKRPCKVVQKDEQAEEIKCQESLVPQLYSPFGLQHV